MEDVVKLNWLLVNNNAELNILKSTHKSLYDEKFPEYFNYLIYTRPGGGGGTPIHYLYGYAPPNGVVILKLLI